MPPKYNLLWVPHKKKEFMFCNEVYNIVATQTTINIKLNKNL
jgi:hypothetical protein